MTWIFRMIVRGVLLLIAAATVRGCDQPTYSVALPSLEETTVSRSAA